MKKNKMMRIAAVLLIVTLLSTCAISGTFAKYVTKTAGEDSARVAKWGVVIEVEENKLFSDVYPTHDQNGYSGTYSVVSDTTDKDDDKEPVADTGEQLVAPGTSSDDIGGFKAHVYGKPEVATRFALKLCSLEDVFLPEGEGYVDYTTVRAEEPADQATFDLQYPEPGTNGDYIVGYSPVKWDLTVSKYTGTTASLSSIAKEVASSYPGKIGKMAEMLVSDDGISITDAQTIVEEVKARGMQQELIDKISNKFRSLDIDNLQLIIEDMDGDGKDDVVLSLDFAANQEVNYDFELKWTWAFEQTAPQFLLADAEGDADAEADIQNEWVDLFDKCDTYLGNAIAGVIPEDNLPEDIGLGIGFAWEASATQID